MEIPTTKICSKCIQEKPLTTEFFNTQLRGLYGFKSYCKSCQSVQYKIWQEANKERLQAKSKAAYAADPQKNKDANTAWRKANPEKRRESNKASRERHKEQRRLDSIEWARNNPEANKAIKQAYVGRRREAEGSFTSGQFQKVIAFQKGLCFYCGEPGGLITEHVVPLSREGTNWIANIVASCVSCNGKKGTKTLEEFRPDLMDTFKLLKSNEL